MTQGPCRTLMRPPVVKRHTSPTSGGLAFFRRSAPGVVLRWQRVLTGLLLAGTALLWRPHTLMEGLPPWRGRGPRAGRRCSAPEQPRGTRIPSSAQARRHLSMRPCAPGAGAGPPPGTLRQVRPLARRERPRPSQRAGAGQRASGRMGVRRRHGGRRAEPGGQARPSCPSEAVGAPAPRPEGWSTRASSPTTSRGTIDETARARGCAKPVHAWPGPGGVSQRASEVGPAGGWRRHRPAAAATAHVRDAGPRGVPAGP